MQNLAAIGLIVWVRVEVLGVSVRRLLEAICENHVKNKILLVHSKKGVQKEKLPNDWALSRQWVVITNVL